LVDGVRPASAASVDLGRDVARLDDPLDLLVDAVLRLFLRLRGLGGLALFLCLVFLVSGQSFVEKRFHCAIPSRWRLTPGRIPIWLFKSSHTFVRQNTL